MPTTLQLAPAILQNLQTRHIWIDPSLQNTKEENAISASVQNANFSVRVLIARALPKEITAKKLAQIVAQQSDNLDGLTIVATTDDAHLALFDGVLDAPTLKQIETDSAPTWTQENNAAGIAQVLRLVAHQRKLRAQSWFLRVILPAIIGVSCLSSALVLWLRRKRKHRARREISKNIPTTIPTIEEIETPTL